VVPTDDEQDHRGPFGKDLATFGKALVSHQRDAKYRDVAKKIWGGGSFEFLGIFH